tara:strand:- start:5038 stop:5985 length:948 start_codon:yes stop_codon:yes gene_type:complete
MPFIGQSPLTGAYHVLDAITTSATATYNLQLNSGAYSPASANNLLVSLNGVIQKPGSSFTISGSQITFSSALTSTDSIDFIIALGDVLSIGTPSDGTVDAPKIATNAVETAKINANAVTVAKMASTLDLSSNTVTLNKNASSLVHLRRIDATSIGTTTYAITDLFDHTGFEHFELHIERILGTSSSSNENLDVKFYIGPVGSATLDNGSSTAYTVDNINLGTGTHRNVNGVDNMELFTTNAPNKGWQGRITCVNFGARQNGGYPNMSGTLSSNTVSFISSNTYYDSRNHRVEGLRFAFTNGNVDTFKADLYGVKT